MQETYDDDDDLAEHLNQGYNLRPQTAQIKRSGSY